MGVFISYSRKNKDLATKLKQDLKEVGVDAWMDVHDMEAGFWEWGIDKNIEASSAVLVIVTPESSVSSYVIYEWSYASGLGKVIIPLIFQDITAYLNDKTHHLKLDKYERVELLNGSIDLIKLLRLINNAEKIEENRKATESIPDEVREAVKVLRQPRTPQEWQGAVKILSNHPDKSAELKLLELSQSPIELVSALTSLAFVKRTDFKDPRVLPGLERILQDSLKNNELNYYHAAAGSAIGKIGTDNAVQILIDIYNRQGSHHTSLSRDIVRRYLPLTNNPITKPFFRNILRTSDQEKLVISSIEALGKLSDDEVFDELWDIIKGKSRSEELRLKSIDAVIAIGGKSNILEFKTLLSSYIHSALITPIMKTIVEALIVMDDDDSHQALREIYQTNRTRPLPQYIISELTKRGKKTLR